MEFKSALSILFYLKESAKYAKGTTSEAAITQTLRNFCYEASTQLNYLPIKLYADLDLEFRGLQLGGSSPKSAMKKTSFELGISNQLSQELIQRFNLPQNDIRQTTELGEFPWFGGTILIKQRIYIHQHWGNGTADGVQFISISGNKTTLRDTYADHFEALTNEIRKYLIVAERPAIADTILAPLQYVP